MARKRLLANITYLGLVQVTNYLVPLIAIPILLDRIGLAKYGIISLAFSISSIFLAITDYGYNLTGTRDVSKHRDSSDHLRALTSEILQVRFVLVIGGFLILAGLTWIIPTWREESFVILTTYLIVGAHAVFPIWYFQGIEKMEVITMVNFFARVLYLVGILWFIRSESDYIYVNIINGAAWMFTAIAGLWIVLRKLRLSPIGFSMEVVRRGLVTNFPIFLSKMTTAAHRNSALIIGGFFLPSEPLGLFAIFDKIIAVLVLSGSVVFRAFFARVSEITKEGFERVRNFFIRFLKIAVGPTVVGSLLLGSLGPWLLGLITTIDSPEPIGLYFWLVAGLPVMLIVNIPLSLTLIAFNRRRHFFYYNFAGMVAMLAFGVAGAFYWQVTGLIFATLLAELMMIVVGFVNLRKDLVPHVAA